MNTKKVHVTVNEDGLFCINFRGEIERMAFGTEHLKEELQAMGAERVSVPELNREYAVREL